MVLYKVNYNDEIIELNVIKETPKTLVYTLPNEITGNTLRKADIDEVRGKSIDSQVATSKAILKHLVNKIYDADILFAKKRYEKLKENKNRILNKL